MHKYSGPQTEGHYIFLLCHCSFPKFPDPNNDNSGSCNEKFRKYNWFPHDVRFVKKEEVVLNKAYCKKYQVHSD